MSVNSIIHYYSNFYNELDRHSDPFGVIQEARTKELITRYLSTGIESVLDVGGAGGTYAFYLADLGYDVSLLDIVPKHIDYVRNLNVHRDHKLTEIILCDALTFDTDMRYDLILLHGPLYHLVERADRVRLLSRIRKILSSNGLLLGFGINRHAGYFYGVHSGQLLNSHYREMVFNEIKTGKRGKEPGWYFHKPNELVQEFEDSGYDVISLKSVSSQIWMLPDIDMQLKSEDRLNQLLKIAEEFEDEVEIGQDLLCVGRIDNQK